MDQVQLAPRDEAPLEIAAQCTRQAWSIPELRTASVATATLALGQLCSDGLAPRGLLSVNSLCAL